MGLAPRVNTGKPEQAVPERYKSLVELAQEAEVAQSSQVKTLGFKAIQAIQEQQLIEDIVNYILAVRTCREIISGTVLIKPKDKLDAIKMLMALKPPDLMTNQGAGIDIAKYQSLSDTELIELIRKELGV